MRYKILTSLIQITLLALAIYIGVINSQLDINYFLIGYLWVIIFTLPSLLSKLVFNKGYFGISAVLSFLYYPISYLVLFLIAKITHSDLSVFVVFLTVFTVALWNLSLLILNFTEPVENVKKHLTFGWVFIALSVFLFAFLSIAGRTPNSIVANDYLTHKTVVYQMATDTSKLCVVPSQCSNLFLLDSYTTFYHTLIIQPLEGFKFSPIYSSFALDIVFSLFIIILIYLTAKKLGLKNLFAIFAAITAFAVFDSGAFTATIFIPQTMAFMLALMLINSGKLTLKALILSLLVLLPVHLIMGIYCFILLLLYYFIVEKDFFKKSDIGKKTVITLSLFSLTFMTLLSMTGFGFEKIFQPDELEKLGFATNYYFPNNIRFLFEMTGLGTFVFILCFIYYAIKGKNNKYFNFLIIAITFELVVFLAAPIYANKFLIGIGAFIAIFTIGIISELKQSETNKLFFSFYTFVLVAISFITQYRYFLLFYTQSDGETSAFVKKDLPMVTFVRNNRLDCYYVSDPQTQLTIASLADKITASGHFMSLDSRRDLYELIKSPNDLRLDKILNLSELGNKKDICLVYSARLKEYVDNKDENWTFNIYTYKVDYSTIVNANDEIEKYLSSKRAPNLYNDDYYSIYLIHQVSN